MSGADSTLELKKLMISLEKEKRRNLVYIPEVGDIIEIKLVDDVEEFGRLLEQEFEIIDINTNHTHPIQVSEYNGDTHWFKFDQVEFKKRPIKPKKNAEVSKGGALRYNKGKPQFSHLSPSFITEMMKGMTKANEKYPYLNYTKKQDVRTASDSLMRHFLKFQQGDDIDEELGVHHLALVAINAMIVFQNLQDFGDEVDNRYEKAKKEAQGD